MTLDGMEEHIQVNFLSPLLLTLLLLPSLQNAGGARVVHLSSRVSHDPPLELSPLPLPLLPLLLRCLR